MVTRHTRAIILTYVCPMFCRRHWMAAFEGHDDGDPIGQGKDETEAIRNLLIAADMDDDK